ncbi:modulator of levamisole receptor-1 domain-containing protein [Ditylenchus destructor]|uniref:Modulator of levamisole receptor-1 domain-containing protein n=1 Tax=Ditylenchus destructor TaxID=166010 RepID=A0AAD4NGI5_9BILA|nr:modulator of levamisole receptor-1 domain-containing protein [Ditylenchus destructor]
MNLLHVSGHKDWTNSAYPDLRGPTYTLCASRIPENSLLYICDPDRIFNASQLIRINTELERLAVGTPCPCQRRSQCTSGGDSRSPFHGFVVSIALVDNLQMTFHSPSEQQLIDRAESFCKTLEGRWALGDCGNSVIVFVWRHYKKMIIWPARLAERYITSDEKKDILTRVNDLIQTDRWAEALTQVVYELHHQLKGEPEQRVDTGTLSLIIAVGVASALTILITCCVCAFRCCGNLKSQAEESKLPNRTKSTKNHITHEDGISQLQRSLSRSPNFPIRNAAPPSMPNFFSDPTMFSDTTVV